VLINVNVWSSGVEEERRKVNGQIGVKVKGQRSCGAHSRSFMNWFHILPDRSRTSTVQIRASYF